MRLYSYACTRVGCALRIAGPVPPMAHPLLGDYAVRNKLGADLYQHQGNISGTLAQTQKD